MIYAIKTKNFTIFNQAFNSKLQIYFEQFQSYIVS